MTATATAVTTEKVSPQLQTSEIVLKKVLVAIDFSEQTPRIMEAALAIARSFRSELILVHGATPQIYGTGAEPSPIETLEVALDVAKAMMTAVCPTAIRAIARKNQREALA